MSKRFDGSRIRAHLNSEVEALFATYAQFSALLPNATTEGAAHRGEDGRFVETLIRTYLRRLLPRGLEVLTGFILRPAVKTGVSGQERRGQKDAHSGQLDIIVFDTLNYPVFQRFEDSAIVPPEGVVAIFSVKKHLRDADVQAECKALRHAAELCRCIDTKGEPIRGPFLGLLSARSFIDKVTTPTHEWIFREMQTAYEGDPKPTFDSLIGLVGTLRQGCIFKARPVGDPPTSAKYVWIKYAEDEQHYALQMALTGVLSVHFDETRNVRRRPGYSGFESGRAHDQTLGDIPVAGTR